MSDTTPTPEAAEVEATEPTEDATPITDTDPATEAKRAAAQAKREATILRKQLEELQAKEEERRQAELSEVEREKERADMLAAELTSLRDQQTRAERASWIREAAREARIDPDVAAAMIGVGDLETSEDAAAAVAQLAKAKPGLVEVEQAAPAKIGTHGAGAPPKADDPETGMANFLLGILGNRR